MQAAGEFGVEIGAQEDLVQCVGLLGYVLPDAMMRSAFGDEKGGRTASGNRAGDRRGRGVGADSGIERIDLRQESARGHDANRDRQPKNKAKEQFRFHGKEEQKETKLTTEVFDWRLRCGNSTLADATKALRKPRAVLFGFVSFVILCSPELFQRISMQIGTPTR